MMPRKKEPTAEQRAIVVEANKHMLQRLRDERRYIAAAPALIEALKALLHEIDPKNPKAGLYSTNGETMRRVKAAAEAAIEKAEGGA